MSIRSRSGHGPRSLLVAMAMLAAATACSSSQSSPKDSAPSTDSNTTASAAAATNSAAATKIKLGLVFTLTGTGSQFGIASQRGADLAVEQINSAGKVHVDTVIQDDQGVATSAVSAVKQLIETQGIKAIVGTSGSVAGVPAAPIANSNKVVMLSPWVSAPSFTSDGGYTLRTHLIITTLERQMGKYASTKLGMKHVAVMYANTVDAQAAAGAFQDAFKAGGGDVVDTEVVPPGTTDLHSQLAKIAGHHPDSLYVFLINGTDMANAFKQAQSLGLKVHFFGPNTVNTPDFLKAAGSAAEGTTFAVPGFDINSDVPAVKDFVTAFTAKYGSAPDIVAANAYDDTNLLVKAIQAVGYDGTAIRTWLHAVKDYPGVSGTFSFDARGDVVGKSIEIMTVKDGKFTPLETFQGS
jgi:branched-chain amino acid transport system substrate-binding protein